MKIFVIIVAFVCLIASVSLLVASLYVDLKTDRKKFLTLTSIAAVIIGVGITAIIFGMSQNYTYTLHF